MSSSINTTTPKKKFELSTDASLQSPYLRLQAAGSWGANSSWGFHCRWFLDGFLGQNHIPKGNNATTNNFYNKPDDFVNLYRVCYEAAENYTHNFSLFELKPNIIFNSEYIWMYTTGADSFFLRFVDQELYDEILQTIDPNARFLDFLRQYGKGVLELELLENLSYAINITLAKRSSVLLETFSIANQSFFGDTPVISARKALRECSGRIVAENIRLVRFSVENGSQVIIGFETYQSLLDHSVKMNLIEHIDSFALTVDKEVAMKRLEEHDRVEVHGRWRKFNDDAYVNVNNYEDRWSTNRGLEEGLRNYLSLSEFDPQAMTTYQDESDNPDGSFMDLSLLKFLNVASLDYHIARMMGLGYIDTFKKDVDEPVIFLVEYVTEKDPEDYNFAMRMQHLCFSLPTAISTERPPLDVVLEPVQYGLDVTNGTGNPLAITDAQGYSLYEPVRFVKLKAFIQVDHSQYDGFFNPWVEFQSSDFTTPVFVGIENRQKGETEWRNPELSHHERYVDTEGVLETQVIYFDKNSTAPTYIHRVTEEGADEYVVYPVNIFSRTWERLGLVATDETKFPVANTLKAPVNVAVQLVQEENPLLLTSAQEQQWLQQIDPDKKEIFARLSFEYKHIHDLNYRFGNRVEVFHKKHLPVNIIGSLTLNENTDTNVPECVLRTGNYSYLSTGQQFVPIIVQADKAKFIGSKLTYRNVSYTIIDIIDTQADGRYPSIKIKKNETREAIFVNGTYQLKQVFQSPELDGNEAFLIVENLSVAANWAEATPNRLAFEIDLGQSAWPAHTETYLDSEGNVKEEIVKGIWDTAAITPVPDQEGVYEVVFDNQQLSNHPQFIAPDNAAGVGSVNWYRGSIRVHLQQDIANNQQRKECSVLQIEELNTGNRLKLLIADNDLSATPGENIKTGNGISVNFHPGYRVYLRKDNAAAFNQASILPAEDEGSRTSLIGLRTLDTNTLDRLSQPYASPMSVPAMLMARELKPPKAPRKPIGPLFATPPDYFNKSSYSFEVEFEHKPWGIVGYRASLDGVLASLYAPATIEQIKATLPPVKMDVFLEERWGNLLSFDYGSNAGEFERFEQPDGSLYKFPNPNRSPEFDAPYNKPGDVVNKIKDAVYNNLLPLTEQPLIFEFIKGGNYVPQPKKQSITDRNGKLLHPTHPDFDQAPMAKRLSDTKILFTDFTLDGNMHSNTAYVYVVREISRSMQMGEPGPFVGPVQLLNTKAPEKLQVQKMLGDSPSAFNSYKPSVQFVVNKFLPGQEITGIQILRGLNGASALSPRSMTLVKEIAATELDLTADTFIVTDDFSNDTDVPFGAPLYYKLVGVRRIQYTDLYGQSKEIKVFSDPTKTLLANVVDTVRPQGALPEVINVVSTGDTISQVDIRWNKTCYNGKYVLSFLNAANAWQKLYEVTSNDVLQLQYSWSANLNKFDERGNAIYYKIKVEVTNTSGLESRADNIVSFRAV